MPSRTTKGAGKSHIRGPSASSTSKLNGGGAFARNKSSERIKRNASDHHVGRNTHAHASTSQHPHAARTVVLQVETGVAGDDDEWVSSESGAATPAEEDAENVPHDSDAMIPSTTPRGDQPLAPTTMSVAPTSPTPTPTTQTQLSNPPASIRPTSRPDLLRVNTVTKFTTHAEDSPSSDSGHDPGWTTPTHTHNHRHAPGSIRRPATRPPSTRSVHSTPHPLIRARSYASSTPTSTAAPAISPNTAQVFPLSSPPQIPDDILSPTSALTAPPSNGSPTSESHPYHTHPRLRRQASFSSVTSVATLPLPTTTSAATASTTRVHGERQRTLSHASTSAALSSLAAARHSHAPSRPSSPVIPIAFPPINPREEHVQMHSLMFPPLVHPHLSATAHQNPILESLKRVMEAKAKAGR